MTQAASLKRKRKIRERKPKGGAGTKTGTRLACTVIWQDRSLVEAWLGLALVWLVGWL